MGQQLASDLEAALAEQVRLRSDGTSELRTLQKALASAGDLVSVLQVRVDQHRAAETLLEGTLRQAVSFAQRELGTVHGWKRAERLKPATAALEALLDRDALEHCRYRIYGFDALAPCTKVVVRLDQAVGYRDGHYGCASDSGSECHVVVEWHHDTTNGLFKASHHDNHDKR